jgi:hypothetical protein
MRHWIAAAGVALVAAPAAAQDLNYAEVVVTGSWIEQDDYSRDMLGRSAALRALQADDRAAALAPP